MKKRLLLVSMMLVVLLPAMLHSIPQNFVLVEGGTFQMGSLSGRDNEKPMRQVTVKSFYINKYPVTQKEWFDVMGTTIRQQRDMQIDRRFASTTLYGEGGNYPIYYVNWFDAVEFCNKLSEMEGLNPVYTISERTPETGFPVTNAVVTADWNANGYRLPTEAEWEYAAKGGNKSRPASISREAETLDAEAWHMGNSKGSTNPVGTKKPNALGLYDMRGNVWEWCYDRYRTYPREAQTDPTGPASGLNRTRRGGAWDSPGRDASSTSRGSDSPANKFFNMGFRLALSVMDDLVDEVSD